jgi:hypothetical protein
MKSQKSKYDDIRHIINAIADEINSDLNNKTKEKYFHDAILLYSFIENLIKWLLFVKLIWDKSKKPLKNEEVVNLKKWCKSSTFYNAVNAALHTSLIDLDLYKKIDKVRQERNDVIHQLWLYQHRNNRLVLRKKLEKLANVASELVGIFNKLSRKIGVDELYIVAL